LYDNLNTDIKEYIAIRFLITDDENKKQEFNSEVRKLVTTYNKELTILRKEKGVLKRQARHSDITYLEEQLKNAREKSTLLLKQVNHYEELTKDFDMKLETQASNASDKLSKLFHNTQKLQKDNSKLASLLKSAKTQVESLEKQTTKQFNELTEKSKTISDLRDVISHREDQLGINK
jgi:predicted  nucleic acid-binding Zn-ribbon protein